MRYLYSNAEQIKKKLRQDWDCVMVIDGDERRGKSTLGYLYCKAVDPEFPGEDAWQICYTYSEFYSALDRVQKYQAIMLDEGAEMFYKLDFMTTQSKQAKKCMMRIGAKNLFIVIVCTNFWDLDKFFTNRRVRIWAHVKERGKYDLRIRKKGPFDKEVFWEYVFTDIYPKLSKEDWKIYLKRKHSFLSEKESLMDDTTKKQDAFTKAVIKLRKEGWSYRKMAKLFGCHPHAIEYYLKKIAPRLS